MKRVFAPIFVSVILIIISLMYTIPLLIGLILEPTIPVLLIFLVIVVATSGMIYVVINNLINTLKEIKEEDKNDISKY